MSQEKSKRRNGYYYKEEKEYPSVTSILSIIAKPALVYWYGSQAAKIALKTPELNDKEVMAQLQLGVRDTQDRGREVHNIVEVWAKEKILPKTSKYQGFLDAIKSFIEAHKVEPLSSEIEVYSDKYLFAGRVDFIGKINGLNWIIDFKSGNNLYPEVSLQNIAYKIAIEEQEICKIDKTGAVLFSEDSTFTFKETKASIDDFLACYQMWKWSKSKALI